MRSAANNDSRGDQGKGPEMDTLKLESVDCEGTGGRGDDGSSYGRGEHELKNDDVGEIVGQTTWLG